MSVKANSTGVGSRVLRADLGEGVETRPWENLIPWFRGVSYSRGRVRASLGKIIHLSGTP